MNFHALPNGFTTERWKEKSFPLFLGLPNLPLRNHRSVMLLEALRLELYSRPRETETKVERTPRGWCSTEGKWGKTQTYGTIPLSSKLSKTPSPNTRFPSFLSLWVSTVFPIYALFSGFLSSHQFLGIRFPRKCIAEHTEVSPSGKEKKRKEEGKKSGTELMRTSQLSLRGKPLQIVKICKCLFV